MNKNIVFSWGEQTEGNCLNVSLTNRRMALDFLKSISIVAVVLYHLGIMKNGYLGVEVFFVISGYNFAKKAEYKDFREDVLPATRKIFSKQYFLIMYSCLVSLVIGFLFLFPIYFKGIGYDSVAALLLSSNILDAVQSTDYWNTANALSPEMHLWYICVSIKSQILLMLTLWGIYKITGKKLQKQVYCVLLLISVGVNFIPNISESLKFYLVAFRLYEMLIGCVVYEIEKAYSDKNFKISGALIKICYTIILSVILFSSVIDVNRVILKLLALVSTGLIVFGDKTVYQIGEKGVANMLCFLGRHSYPIYIWHQVVIAFMLLFVFEKVNALCFFLVISVTALFTILSEALAHNRMVIRLKKSNLVTITTFILILLFAGLTYVQKGVFFSYPELGLSSKSEDPDNWIKYVDRVYQWDKDFCDDERKKVLVIGNSFGRDFANILSESTMSDELDITYFYTDKSFDEMKNRIDSANVVFYSVDSWDEPNELIDYCYDKLIIIGNKCFSKNTKVWLKRNQADYYNALEPVNPEFVEMNKDMAKKYGEHYVDMMSVIMIDDSNERVFSEDRYYLSIDGKHLSEEGARYYASKLNIPEIIYRVTSTVDSD